MASKRRGLHEKMHVLSLLDLEKTQTANGFRGVVFMRQETFDSRYRRGCM